MQMVSEPETLMNNEHSMFPIRESRNDFANPGMFGYMYFSPLTSFLNSISDKNNATGMGLPTVSKHLTD